MTHVDQNEGGYSASAPTTAELFSLERAKKAYSAGLAAAIVGAGALAGGIFTDGKIEVPEVVAVIGTGVSAFVVAFFAAWLPSNRV